MSRAAADVDLLLVDVSALCYQNAYQPALSRFAHEGQPTGVLMGTINSIAAVVDRHPRALPIILWDGRAEWRYKLLPEYKSGRDDTPEKQRAKELVRTQSPWVRMLLTDLGLPQLRHPGAEADDLAGLVTAALCNNGAAIRLYTSDTDWWQVIGENVDVLSDADGEPVDLHALQSMTGTKKAPADGWRSPLEYLQAKIMSGDSSDKIPGIDGVGLITAAKILRSAPGGFEDVLRGNVPGNGKIVERVCTPESRDTMLRNILLMDWAASEIPAPNELAAWAHSPQVEMAVRGAEDFGLKTLAKRLPKVFGKTDFAANPLWRMAVDAVDWAPHNVEEAPSRAPGAVIGTEIGEACVAVTPGQGELAQGVLI